MFCQYLRSFNNTPSSNQSTIIKLGKTKGLKSCILSAKSFSKRKPSRDFPLIFFVFLWFSSIFFNIQGFLFHLSRIFISKILWSSRIFSKFMFLTIFVEFENFLNEGFYKIRALLTNNCLNKGFCWQRIFWTK